MTTEDDFQKALDAHPEDWQTRLVFADWLQERGDQRAEGYRALGLLRLYPAHAKLPTGLPGGMLRDNWEHAMRAVLRTRYEIYPHAGDVGTVVQKGGQSRRIAEDAAALAFARLSPERRAELVPDE